MQAQKSGSVVYISSIAGYTAIEGLGGYSVSKTALLGLSKVKKDLKKIKIKMSARLRC
jgi:short-subunit dehydrogenase